MTVAPPSAKMKRMAESDDAGADRDFAFFDLCHARVKAIKIGASPGGSKVTSSVTKAV